MASETTVGSIVGFMRLDGDQFHREIERAIAEVDALDGRKANVKITADGAERASASTRRTTSAMDEATVASRRFSDATDKVKLAQLRLDEVQGSSTAKASQIVRAQQALNKAMRDESDAGAAVTRSRVAVGKASTDAEIAAMRLTTSNERVEKSSNGSARGMRALATAIVTVGPAIVPLAAASVGLAAGFGAMGTAGVLAIVGIKHEMAEGTTVGRAYSAQVDTLKGDLNALGSVAAKGVLGPFQDAVASLQGQMPHLTRMIGEFSTITGKTAAAVTTGLVASFVALEPLMRDVATYTFGLSERFRDLMSGPGVVTFGEYVRSVFPQVMQAVEALVGAAVHLVAALAPLGMGILTALGALADVISAIPVDVLAALATTASSVFLGFKSYGLISGLIEGVSGALVKMGISAGVAAAGMAALNIAAAGIGAIVAVATFLYTQHAEAVRKDQQTVDDYTDALRRSNGVIDENIRQKAFQILQDGGAYDAAKKLGIALNLVTDAALGNVPASRELAREMQASAAAQNEFEAGGKRTGLTSAELNGALNTLNETVGTNTGQITRARDAQQRWAEVSKTSTAATGAQDAAQAALAGRLSSTVTALETAQDAQKKTADAANEATLKMQLENDAAGLLKQSLDALSGKSLSTAQAQSAFDQQLVGLKSAQAGGSGPSSSQKNAVANATDRVRIAEERLADARKKGTTGTRLDSLEASLASARRSLATANSKVAASNVEVDHSLTGMSKGAVDNRSKMLGLVQAAQQLGEAYGEQVGSGEKGRQKLIDLKKEIVDNAAKTGMNRKEVQKFIDTVFKIPKSIPPTKAELDTKAAMRALQVFQSAINGLTGKTVQVYATAHIESVREAGKTALANAMDTANSYATNAAYNSSSSGKYKPGHADGTASANGNIFRAFASGGIESHVAQIAPAGAMRLWAEPETGGEAYIPLAPSKRARSTAILEETNRLMGNPLGDRAGQRVGSRTSTVNVTHTGDIVANDPAEYERSIRRTQRLGALLGQDG